LSSNEKTGRQLNLAAFLNAVRKQENQGKHHPETYPQPVLQIYGFKQTHTQEHKKDGEVYD
jgi:hypothetical protein